MPTFLSLKKALNSPDLHKGHAWMVFIETSNQLLHKTDQLLSSPYLAIITAHKMKGEVCPSILERYQPPSSPQYTVC